MTNIVFNKNAACETGLYEGPFQTRAEVEGAATVIPEPAQADFEEWKRMVGAPATQTHFLTPFWNANHLRRCHVHLQDQAATFAAGGDGLAVANLNFKLSPDLLAAFAAAGQAGVQPVRLLCLEATRETVVPALQATQPNTVLRATLACPTPEDAVTRNKIVRQVGNAELANLITYTADWRGQKADLVFINSWLYTLNESDLQRTISDVAATRARQIVIASTMTTDSKQSEWQMQRYFGGGMAIRLSHRNEIPELMEKAGYQLTRSEHAPPLYDRAASVPATVIYPHETQYVFVPR